MGQVDDYGFICLLLSYLMVFACMIRFRSIATIMLFLGIGGGTMNIAYGWGLLFIFMVTRYFYIHRYELEPEDEDEQTDDSSFEQTYDDTPETSSNHPQIAS